MRKIFLSVVSILSISIASGQQTAQPEPAKTTEKTTASEILPVKGDWGLSIGATTTLNYFGNFFGKTVANANSAMFNYANKKYPMAVVAGKYFLEDNKALRLGACIYYNNSKNNILVHDDTNLDPDVYVNDVAKTNTAGYTIALGLEKRRGYKRVQGIYGGEVFIGNIGKQNYDYEYGNKFSQVNTAPTSTSFLQYSKVPAPSWGYRITSDHTSGTFTCGARAFAGIEIFFCPKMSIGGEFNWGFEYKNFSKETTTWEYYNTVLNEIKSGTIESKHDRSLNIGLDNVGGNVNFNFYF